MHCRHQTNDEQTKFWNGVGGDAWIDLQALLNQMFKPFTDLLIEASSARLVGRVLDVGCGTGSMTLAFARLLGVNGCCTGIDISEPLVAAARARAEQEDTSARFIRADAQTHVFPPACFDMLLSRFGVMFFDDPVQAFANLRRAARKHAEFRFIAWRSPSENPFMTTAERAAAPLLPGIPARRSDAQGQFAFADRLRIFSLLEEGGWDDIDIRPIDVVCTLPEKELVRYFTRLSPLGRVLQEVDARARIQVIETVRGAFDPYVHGAEVRFTAACWIVSARAAFTPAAP